MWGSSAAAVALSANGNLDAILRGGGSGLGLSFFIVDVCDLPEEPLAALLYSVSRFVVAGRKEVDPLGVGSALVMSAPRLLLSPGWLYS